jgi:3-(3-hydroxy-phenyl)propionate hydroxylase
LGRAVVSVRTDADGATIELAGGEELRGPYVIAADGARSAVRKSLEIAMDGHTDDVPFIIVDVEQHPDGSTPGQRTRFDYLSPALGGRDVMYMPFAGGIRVDIQCRRGDNADQMATREGIRDWMSKILDPWYAEHVQWVSTYRFQQVVANSYTDQHRRVLLAGEAAHLSAPFGGGRGLNSGVIDATDAASAISRALMADIPAAAGEIDGVAIDRRAAGMFNRDAAANALRVMRGEDPLTRAKRE